jgi:hypothetical protein
MGSAPLVGSFTPTILIGAAAVPRVLISGFS